MAAEDQRQGGGRSQLVRVATRPEMGVQLKAEKYHALDETGQKVMIREALEALAEVHQVAISQYTVDEDRHGNQIVRATKYKPIH